MAYDADSGMCVKAVKLAAGTPFALARQACVMHVSATASLVQPRTAASLRLAAAALRRVAPHGNAVRVAFIGLGDWSVEGRFTTLSGQHVQLDSLDVPLVLEGNSDPSDCLYLWTSPAGNASLHVDSCHTAGAHYAVCESAFVKFASH